MPETLVTVAVDANGADLGPEEVAAGAAIAVERGVRVKLYGDVSGIAEVPDGVELIDAPQDISKDPDPARAVRNAPGSSIVRAAKAVGAGEADALVSGGATGAALAAGMFHVKRIRGVHRPALALPVPIPHHPVLLLDVGASTEARTEHLVQFAYMGAAFAGAVLGVATPRVALLCNGEEPGKGTEAVRTARATLEECAGVNFVGYVEGDGITSGAADVIVTDGFTGNVALKLIEGVAGALLGAVREAAMSSPRAKAGGLLLKPALRGLRAEIDPEGPGGAYMLGLRHVGVVAHGRFSRYGFSHAILLAARGANEGVVEKTRTALESAGALRTVPQDASDAATTLPSR